MEKEQETLITEFIEVTYKESVIETPIDVKGGLLHKLYKVDTNQAEYAVKLLNPVIMKREQALTNMINSEKISASLFLSVPAVVAKGKEGDQVTLWKGQYFMIYDWLDGKSIFPPDISEDHCHVIGAVLGKIHSLNSSIPGIEMEEQSYTFFDWNYYLDLGKKENKMWVPVYEEALDDLINWNQKMLDAQKILSTNKVISHRDLDPKNVMWQGNQPYLIDWEAAGYVNPYQELLEVLNYWADDGNGGLNKKNFMALLNSYKMYQCMDGVNWEIVLAAGYEGMLGWLEYNLKRALSIEAVNKNEILLGEQQVLVTIRELKSYTEKTKLLKEWL